MALLIKAELGSKADGIALFPYSSWREQRVSVRLLDDREKEQERLLTRLTKRERFHVEALLQLRGALEGRSATVAELIGSSRPVLSMTKTKAAHEEVMFSQDGRPIALVSEGPMDTNTGQASFLIGLNPDELVAALITLGMFQVRPCAWIDNAGHLKPGMFCADHMSALYALAIFGKGLGSCRHCGQLFVRSRPDDGYCSQRHKWAFQKASQRKAHKKKSPYRSSRLRMARSTRANR